MPYLTGSGALTGLFLSREIALQRASTRPGLAARERVIARLVPLGSTPTSLLAMDSVLYVAGDSGITVLGPVSEPRALRRRAAGLRGLQGIALTDGSDASRERMLLIGTDAARFITGDVGGAISRTVPTPIRGVAAQAENWVAAGVRTVYAGTGALVDGRTLRTTDSLSMSVEIRSMSADVVRGIYWVATDSSIVEVRLSANGSISRGNELTLPAPVHAVAVSARSIVAATDDQRLLIWPKSSIDSPTKSPEILSLGASYPYAIAFRGQELFVAAGAEGVLRVAIEPKVELLGTIADVRFATTISVGPDGTLWVADRNRSGVVRLTVPTRAIYR
ncbi:hypothetical protein [Gemmatimonas sp.]|uniref:hypothetical protein n=1 Tax=Gemmatimonas sp. TaxID=1962908 RepID=UPI00333E945A